MLVQQLAAALYPNVIPIPTGVEDAREHASQRLRLGFNVWEVVREYGLLQECILEYAARQGVEIPPEEQVLLARWISRRMADAISQYVHERDAERDREASRHLGFIAHELRNPLYAARLALDRLREKELAGGGRPVEVLDRSLRRTSQLIEDTLTRSSLRLGLEPNLEPIDLPAFLGDLERDAAIEGQARNVAVDITAPPGLTVDADPRLLRSAVANLISNAVKFSRPGTRVQIAAERTETGVSIDVADGCGGLPTGKADELFQPVVQRGTNRSGFGLGLAIAAEAAGAHSGEISVRNLPGQGCVFTLTLPSAGATSPSTPE